MRLIVLERAAGELRPLDRILALLDPLLSRAATVVKFHDVLRVLIQVGRDEPDAGKQLTRLPFDLRNHAPRPLPRFGLILEAMIKNFRLRAC